MQRNKTLILFFLPIMLFTSFGLAGCSQAEEGAAGSIHLDMAGEEILPPQVQDSPEIVQESYRFAAANPDILTKIPCYCGCGEMGHTSNYSCYVAGTDEGGALQFDTHAIGCSICIDITQDAMRLLRQGKTVDQIRQYVDDQYARYGPSNME